MALRLPLFPLGTVLFPGLLLPLHVFEERYRQLVGELLAIPPGEPRRFGVVAIRQGREVGADGVAALYDVGCTAEVRRVTPHPDGRFDLVTSGATRFRLLSVDDALPYLTGEVELLDEPVGEVAEAALVGPPVAETFRHYLDALGRAQRSPIQPPELPDDPLLLSYLVAATALLDLGDRQRLLAEPTASRRLRAELALLRRETAMLRLLSAVPATDLTRAAVAPN